LDQVAVVINTEKTRDLAKNGDTVYKKNFKKKGFANHTAQKKELDHPVKIYAPGVTPKGNQRFPWKTESKFFLKIQNSLYREILKNSKISIEKFKKLKNPYREIYKNSKFPIEKFTKIQKSL